MNHTSSAPEVTSWGDPIVLVTGGLFLVAAAQVWMAWRSGKIMNSLKDLEALQLRALVMIDGVHCSTEGGNLHLRLDLSNAGLHATGLSRIEIRRQGAPNLSVSLLDPNYNPKIGGGPLDIFHAQIGGGAFRRFEATINLKEVRPITSSNEGGLEVAVQQVVGSTVVTYPLPDWIEMEARSAK